ncbi:VCBS repeat-containing protein [Paenibacillus oenotherae]|uniref:VCBS repeat-containing protein n=1 Tax=Paenibacillus oenotherae TaxID=1435645 RepID=A0ABS7D4X6_9BACL|nr:VCBS repeat-containing protein [Paenibacillus oenotherae]MBW7474853.1 VCBS repeat-containing protein [Paenibacillus oenotherae]
MKQLRWGWRKRLTGLCLLSLMILTGCQYTATPADLLLNPRSTPENERLASAVKDALPPKAKLSLPLEAQSISAVNKQDVDGDGREEAVVTFMNENGTQQVMLLRASDDGSWKYWFTIAEMSSYGIDRIMVEDMDDNGQPEVLIGWGLYGQPEYQLNIYQIRKDYTGEEPLLPAAKLPYNTLEIGEVDGDGHSEIVLILLDREEMRASLQVYRAKENTVYRAASVPLSGAVNGYYNLAVGKIAADRYGLVTDASIGAHSSATTMFAWSEGNLMKVYPSARPSSPGEGYNIYSTEGGDGNKDGILDLHVMQEAPGQNPEISYAETLFIQQYLQWNGRDEFQQIQERYADYTQGYAIDIPLAWQGMYTISRPRAKEETGIVFEYYNVITKERAALFTIHPVPLAEWGDIEQQWQDGGVQYAELVTAAGIQYAAVWGEPPALWSREEKERYRQVKPDKTELKRLFEVLPSE